MPDHLLAKYNRQSQLSVAYAQVAAAKAGYTTAITLPDRDTVDMTIRAGGAMRPALDLQIKSCSTLTWREGKASYSLQRKH